MFYPAHIGALQCNIAGERELIIEQADEYIYMRYLHYIHDLIYEVETITGSGLSGALNRAWVRRMQAQAERVMGNL